MYGISTENPRQPRRDRRPRATPRRRRSGVLSTSPHAASSSSAAAAAAALCVVIAAIAPQLRLHPLRHAEVLLARWPVESGATVEPLPRHTACRGAYPGVD